MITIKPYTDTSAPSDSPSIPDESILDMSRQWFAKVDRSLLGSFAMTAVPDEVMIVDHALEIMRADVNVRQQTAGGWAYLKSRSHAYRDGTRPNGYFGELYFWIVTTDDNNNLVDYVHRMITRTRALPNFDRIDELTKVRDFPQYRQFYEAGVWDNALIERCMTEDVDTDMSITLAESETGNRAR